MTKVLVLESDRAFAADLRSEFEKLGFQVDVVEDGAAGLEHATKSPPDLILVGLEPPQGNSFGICNSLKKVPALKDVPVVVMPPNSTDEMFEQHRKLRTRAEVYVHKPVRFADLARRINMLLPLGASGDSDAEALSDDLIEVVESDPPMGLLAPEPAKSEPTRAIGTSSIPPDPEVDDFLGGAFDRLMSPDDEKAKAKPVVSEVQISPLRRMPSQPPTAKRVSSLPPSHDMADADVDAPPVAQFRVSNSGAQAKDDSGAEVQRLRAELERAKNEIVAMSKDLSTARASAQRAATPVSVSPPARGGVSSREFLDLRETLNKKDKELLAMRDQVSHKDKEILDLRDQLLSLERDKADHVDKLIAVERTVADLDAQGEALRADRDAAQKRAEDLAARVAEADRELDQNEAEIERVKQALTAAEAAHVEKLSAAEQAAKAELGRLQSEHAEAQRAAEQATVDALAGQEARLRSEHAEALKAAQAAHAAALDETKSEAAARAAAVDAAHAEALAKAREEADARVAAVESATEHSARMTEAAHAEAIRVTQQEAQDALAEARSDADARVAAVEQAASSALADASAKASADADARLAAAERAAAEAQAAAVADAIAQQKAEADARLAAAERAAAEAQAAAVADAIAQQKAEADARVAAAEADHEETKRRLGGELDAARATDAQTREKLSAVSEQVADLEAKLAQSRGELERARESIAQVEARRGELDAALMQKTEELAATMSQLAAKSADVEQVTAQANDLSRKLSASNQAHAELTLAHDAHRAESERLSAALAVEAARLDKARRKWGEDRVSLDHAKQALAAALGKIEEAQGRDLDD